MTPRWFVAFVVTSALAGCLSDPGTTCGPLMHYASDLGVCVCDDHAIAVGGGCEVCAEDEIVVGDTCGCAPGQLKDGQGVCAQALGLGSPCDVASACTNATYNYCAVRGASGACTSRCAVDAECPASYVCADWEAIPSCRTFTGYGATCAGPSECASYDASFCAQGHCVVQGCTVGTDDCPRDTACCDFSTYGLGTLCVPAGACS